MHTFQPNDIVTDNHFVYRIQSLSYQDTIPHAICTFIASAITRTIPLDKLRFLVRHTTPLGETPYAELIRKRNLAVIAEERKTRKKFAKKKKKEVTLYEKLKAAEGKELIEILQEYNML